MNLRLTRHQQQYIKAKLNSGHYQDASEIVREALRVLEELESHREHVGTLLDEADETPVVEGGPKFWKELRAELHREHRQVRAKRAA